MVKCILFDMNGVLLDSEKVNICTWKHLFESYGLTFNEKIYNNEIDGKTTREVACNKVEPFLQDEFIKNKDYMWDLYFEEEGIEVFYDTIPCLERLRKKGMKLGVITSSRKGTEILTSVGLASYFDIIVTGNDILIGKPSPEIIFKAISNMNVSPEETAIIEDSIAGIKAGKIAGVYCIGLQRTSTIKHLEGDKIINSLMELEDILNEQI